MSITSPRAEWPSSALAGTPHPGRTPFLTPQQQAEALGWLTRKPTEFGFATDLWTAARVWRTPSGGSRIAALNPQ